MEHPQIAQAFGYILYRVKIDTSEKRIEVKLAGKAKVGEGCCCSSARCSVSKPRTVPFFFLARLVRSPLSRSQ